MGARPCTGTPAQVFGRPAELRAMGLDVPAVTLLMDQLAAEGMVPPGQVVYTVDQAEKVLAARMGAM